MRAQALAEVSSDGAAVDYRNSTAGAQAMGQRIGAVPSPNIILNRRAQDTILGGEWRCSINVGRVCLPALSDRMVANLSGQHD